MSGVRRVWVALLFLAATGCQQKMADQPSYRRLEPSALFPDGMSARPLPDGVVAREWTAANDPLASGLKPEFRHASPAPAGDRPPTATPEPDAPTDPGKFLDIFPVELSDADLARGQERFTVFCAVCHGPAGDGDGKIVERGYVKPPSYHTDNSRGFARYRRSVRLTEVPVGYLVEVIARGYGAMPRYGPQLPPADRWRVAAYVRALQLSRHADLSRLSPARRDAARAALEGRP